MNKSVLWEEIFSKKEWGKYPSESVIRFIARNFYNTKDRNSIKILELGLGTGANLWFCAREGFKVSGIEWSKTGVERFKARLKDENLSTQIEQIEIGDYLEKLDDFKDESFDAVIDVASLCCNDREKTRQIFLKAFKKLKVGGKFFSTALGRGALGSLGEGDFFEPKEGIYTNVGKLRFDDELSLKELYAHENLKCLSLSTQILENEGVVLDKILIFEGLKNA
ncbi:class I SAM-dependent methyltransferase [Campylobacter upsaliensis]|uniref:class I SAM-dependent methyltransferase n=1 Tax=Campylobacter upsaliensis TaxID=28080 RepID=UPI0022EB63F0|nr:class I SAM-dependent methyltransferase [Campylobacter upsaliensis]MEB2804207.1 class I SAM-dependent methyltransferase [Campylobacter upsaliensis]MEB2812356.1 class I SAM-dependent methyltransferase [Campylobacter upsaliensis]MEB2823421.1 class I SAM-dependent methyltransferase [Campylobacter upsaliensis]